MSKNKLAVNKGKPKSLKKSPQSEVAPRRQKTAPPIITKKQREQTLYLGGVPNFSLVSHRPEQGKVWLPIKPRIAFLGRSNVGKSSLLNALLGTTIAHVSQTPGRTRLIHFYQHPEFIFVDFPGYGFARVQNSLKEDWAREIPKYLEGDSNLVCVLALIDSQIGPTKQDQDLFLYLQEKEIPFVVVATKKDRIKTQSQSHTSRKLLEQALYAGEGDTKDPLLAPEVFSVSSRTKEGLGTLMNHLRKMVPPKPTSS